MVLAAARSVIATLALTLLQAPPAPVPKADFEAFPAFLWCQSGLEHPPDPSWLAALGGLRLGRGEVPGWLDHERFYVGQVAGRAVLHPERNETELVWPLDQRLEGLRSDAWRDAWATDLRDRLERRNGRFGFGLALGDEPGLTPFGDPLDQRLAAEDDAQIRHGSTPSALGAARTPAAWLARRRAERDGFTETLEWMASTARRAAPDTPIGMLGLGDESTFRGIDLLRTFRAFDFVEAYPGGLATELLLTERALHPGTPRAELWRTVFATRADPGDLRQQLFRAWLAGARAVVVWSDAALASRPDRVDALGEALGHVRSWRASFPELPALPSGVAFLRSFEGLCDAWWREARADPPRAMARLGGWQRAFGVRERLEDGLRLCLSDLGFVPGALASESLDEAASKRFPVWIAVELACLSPELEGLLVRHLQRGGRLWVAGAFGRSQPDRSARGGDLAHEWIDRFPGRVRRLPNGSASYGMQRLDPGSEAAAGVRGTLRSLAREASLEGAPFELSVEDPQAPWARRAARDERGRWICAALPNRSVSGERALPPLPAARVRVELAHPGTIEWFTGTGDDRAPDEPLRRRLAAGEPAVFRVTPMPAPAQAPRRTRRP